MRNLKRTMCNLTCKRACFIFVAILFTALFVSYLVFFNHGPPESIMEANKRTPEKFRYAGGKDSDNMDDIDIQLQGEFKKAFEYWQNFIEKNNFVSIGVVYDSCDEKERTMVGRTIMLPDTRWGGVKGVKSRTFINATLDSELTGGQFYIEVKYNGNDLFSRHWELCTLDEDYGDDRLIFCPFNPGEYSFVKDRQIPVYLPKGRYVTKGWVTNQDDDVILCGFSDFTL